MKTQVWMLFLLVILLSGCQPAEMAVRDRSGEPDNVETWLQQTAMSELRAALLARPGLLTERYRIVVMNNARPDRAADALSVRLGMLLSDGLSADPGLTFIADGGCRPVAADVLIELELAGRGEDVVLRLQARQRGDQSRIPGLHARWQGTLDTAQRAERARPSALALRPGARSNPFATGQQDLAAAELAERLNCGLGGGGRVWLSSASLPAGWEGMDEQLFRALAERGPWQRAASRQQADLALELSATALVADLQQLWVTASTPAGAGLAEGAQSVYVQQALPPSAEPRRLPALEPVARRVTESVPLVPASSAVIGRVSWSAGQDAISVKAGERGWVWVLRRDLDGGVRRVLPGRCSGRVRGREVAAGDSLRIAVAANAVGARYLVLATDDHGIRRDIDRKLSQMPGLCGDGMHMAPSRVASWAAGVGAEWQALNRRWP